MSDSISLGSVGRRKLLHQMAGTVATAFGGTMAAPIWAQQAQNYPGAFTGTDFDLTIGRTLVNFTGRARCTIAVNGSIPAPILRWKQGSKVTLRATNTLDTQTSIHWYSILVPFVVDGVPDVSFPGIPARQTFIYTFKVRWAGTYWYHSHTRFREQLRLYGPLVIEPQEPDLVCSDRDYIAMLSDWTDENPDSVSLHLKQSSDFYNSQLPTVVDFVDDTRTVGTSGAFKCRRMWNEMRMNPTNLADVSAATYSYLVNGTTPFANWTAVAKVGERVRLRFTDGSATTTFDVRIPGLTMRVYAADGQDVEAVDIDEFRIGVAETYDVLVQMLQDAACMIFAQAMDHSGYARVTLALKPGMRAKVPPMDPRTWLSMVGMGMETSGVAMGEEQPSTTMRMPDNGSHSTPRHSMPEMSGLVADMQDKQP